MYNTHRNISISIHFSIKSRILSNLYHSVNTVPNVILLHVHVHVEAFYLWGSMFVSGLNFLGSWGSNFVGSVIRTILMNIKQMLVYSFMGM